MKYGFVWPNGDPADAVRAAQMAEAAGWDGFFMWEPVWGVDPWVTLGAAAATTTRIRLGTMLTPIAIRKPWKLASETATLDRLSNGRLILATGLGAPETGFASFGEPVDRKTRAELLDEGLDILAGLWRGQPFTYTGKHYQLRETSFTPAPAPIQQPRIPIWVVGAWPREKSMQRPLRWDGILPAQFNAEGKVENASPATVAQIKQYVASKAPFDIVVEGITPGSDPAAAAEILGPWIEAGATWWIEAAWEEKDLQAVFERIRQGPPRAV